MYKILIVDDEPDMILVMAMALSDHDFTITSAPNGREALMALKEDSDIDLVISDLKMPVMDGIGLAKRMQVDFPDMPLIIMTGFADVSLTVQAMKYGAADFIPKPFSNDIMLEAINRNLAKSQRLKNTKAITKYLSGQIVYNLPIKDYTSIEALVDAIADSIYRNGYIEGAYIPSTKTVIHEGLTNAIYHGALGVSSIMREQEGGSALFMEEIRKRSLYPEFKRQYVLVVLTLDKERCLVTIEDGGLGFDWQAVMNKKYTADDFLKPHGRGVMLMKGLRGDDVYYNQRGDVLSIVFRK